MSARSQRDEPGRRLDREGPLEKVRRLESVGMFLMEVHNNVCHLPYDRFRFIISRFFTFDGHENPIVSQNPNVPQTCTLVKQPAASDPFVIKRVQMSPSGVRASMVRP